MFRAIVARRVGAAWQHLAGRDYEFVLGQFASPFSHVFVGDHALGGERTSRPAQRAWFERLFRLFPDIEFTVDDVLVRGGPWRARAVALITVRATVVGMPYENEVVQTIDLRWGRIERIHNLEDTQRLAAALDRLAAAGTDEAHAEPITARAVDAVPIAP